MTTRKIAFAAVVAALYAALTLLLAPISFGAVQCRISEALCVLPFFFPFSVWGLFVGCVIANLVSTVPDIVFGSLATLLAAVCTMLIGKARHDSVVSKVLACLPPVVINAVVVGAVVTYGLTQMPGSGAAFWSAYPVVALQVGAGELIALYALGLPLLLLVPKTGLFKTLSAIYEQK